MKPLVGLLLGLGSAALAQRPAFTNDALVGSPTTDLSAKPYLIVLYGAVGCGYTRALLPQLRRFADCPRANVALLLAEPKDSIRKYVPEWVAQYPVYSNAVLGHKLRRRNGVFPQVFVYEGDRPIQYVFTVKAKSIGRIREAVGCPTD